MRAAREAFSSVASDDRAARVPEGLASSIVLALLISSGSWLVESAATEVRYALYFLTGLFLSGCVIQRRYIAGGPIVICLFTLLLLAFHWAVVRGESIWYGNFAAKLVLATLAVLALHGSHERAKELFSHWMVVLIGLGLAAHVAGCRPLV
jgi:hypothetical protein